MVCMDPVGPIPQASPGMEGWASGGRLPAFLPLSRCGHRTANMRANQRWGRGQGTEHHTSVTRTCSFINPQLLVRTSSLLAPHSGEEIGLGKGKAPGRTCSRCGQQQGGRRRRRRRQVCHIVAYRYISVATCLFNFGTGYFELPGLSPGLTTTGATLD